ncbi:hypothetical protein COCCADRAFT_36428 [Bipolaris zeicola 26-R-13]|uniref:Uncharacterized protein n=1 Tax=Cochliobolus carbonum (strain 26-R-13) TaxID=930089 RepID=W6YE26_COCC2|nr:uncharacterized protein COCCADRAFT_36428 [Bipolaris zeicola 26-R-13]EUC33769.1 hypothetical protein COCCADRAFT_36428 [Bipolaris zeicola 26-R-13]
MCKETVSRHRHCTHSRLLNRTYCSLIEPPSPCTPTAARACPRYKQHREKPSAKTPCLACKRQERIREILAEEQETARNELRAAGFSEKNVEMMMVPPPTGFVMPRLFPRGKGGKIIVHPLLRHAQQGRVEGAGDTGLTPKKVDSRSSGGSSDSGLQKEVGQEKSKSPGRKGFKNWIKEFLLAGDVEDAVSIGFPKMDA